MKQLFGTHGLRKPARAKSIYKGSYKLGHKRKRKLLTQVPLVTVLAVLLGTLLLNIVRQPAQALGGQQRIAYYGNWDIYGNDYTLKKVHDTGAADRLTTLVYSFENISPTNFQCFQDVHPVDTNEGNPNGGDGGADAWGDYQYPFPANRSVDGQADSATQPLRGNFNQLKKLKQKHPNLKIMLSIGGWTFSKYFSDAAATPASRQAFVSSCINMFIKGNLPTNVAGDTTAGGAGVAKNIFDGIDIDWEFPGSPNGHLGNHTSPNDTANFTALLAEFRSQLSAQGNVDGKYYRLTAAVPSGGDDINKIQVSQVAQYLDYAGIMSYDMHGAWENTTNFQAPLYPSSSDPDASRGFTIDQAVQRWQNAGLPANKLVVGVPFYWRGWTGVSSGTSNGLYRPASGGSAAFPISNNGGVAHYKELLNGNKFVNHTYMDTTTHSPWIYDGNNFYTGDTPASIAEKGNYIRNKGLAGAMIYSLESDDAQGTMLQSVVAGLNGGSLLSLPTMAATTVAGRTATSAVNTAKNGEPINMFGGNFLATRHEFKVPGKDIPVDFALNYNSALAGQTGSVGWGWTHSYRVTALTDIDGSVVIQNPDNRMDRYVPDGNGGYTPPDGLHDTLTSNNGLFKVTHKDHSAYNFNGKGLLVSIVSPNGNTQTLTYDNDDKLTTLTDSVNRSFYFAYNDYSGLLKTVTDPSGRVVSYTYNIFGELAEVKSAANQITKYSYDASHRITKLTDPRGNDVVVNEYDDQGRVTKQTNGLGKVITLAYEPGKTIYTDAQGGQTTYWSDAQMRLIKVQDALGGITTTTYDAAGNPSQVTDALNHTTTRNYDARGNLTQLTNAAGGTQNFAYDAQDNLVTRTDQLGRVTTYTYNAKGNITQKKDPLNNLTKFAYDASGQMASVTDALNNLTGFVYDVNGNQVTTTDPSNRNTYYGYDSAGRLTAIENHDHDETIYALDPMDRITKATDPSGNNTLFTYDADGNKTKITDANNHATSYEYDANNNLVKTTNALNKTTTYEYDGNNNLVKKTDAKGRQTAYAFDLLNRQTQTNDPLGSVNKLVYDAVGNVTQRIDASNRTTIYAYDNLNRLITTTHPDSSTATNTYDAVGNLLTATNAAGTTTYAYDSLDRLLTVKDPHNATITYTYNALGSPSQIKYPDNKTVTYTYTPSNQLSTATDWNNATTTYLYDNNARLATKTYPNTIKATYAYDENGNLSDLVYKKGNAAFTKYNYVRDNVGDILEDTETKANGTELYTEYTYDALDQLTTTDAPNDTYTYTYDDVGNMLTSANSSGTSTYTYNNGNQLTAKTGRTFTYDPQGNQITDTGKTLAYDYDNHLKSYANGSATTSYIYDASGNRIDKKLNGANNYQYVNAGNNNVLVAKNLTNSTNNFYLYGLDLISQGDTAASSRQYYLPDGQGNVRYVTNNTGATVTSYAYDPFGKQTSGSTTTSNYTFQAEQKDAESSLTYLRARYYDPTIGRFTAQDPYAGTLDNPQTQNGYNYAINDPINLSDPSGELPFSIISAPTAMYSPQSIKFMADYLGITDIRNDIANCNWGGLPGHIAMTAFTVFNQEDGLGEAKGAANLARIAKTEKAAKAAESGVSALGNLRKLSDANVAKLQKAGILETHGSAGVKFAKAKQDIYLDKATDELYTMAKGGKGTPDKLYINVGGFSF
ncbi:MAG TPA: glycosyl hydrolase family 18 protein [Nevskiaceae bacterium]|nr:glycosyl hydrolase family 18 protein [Nevskiaceae bacterium]